MTEDEQALALRSRSGNRAAFEALIRRNSRWVYTQLYLQTGDAHRAEDLTQETFLAAWRRISELTAAAAFRGWLSTIAHHTLLDAVKHERRKKRWTLARSQHEVDPPASENDSPLAIAENAEERQRALEMLRALPEEYRVPLTLRYIGGADYEKISEQLALTNGSLRGLLRRGLVMLREKMNTGERTGAIEAKVRDV